MKHGRANINSRSHNISKFSWANLVLSWLECIFTIKVLYSTITCFNGLNMEIHWILTFFNNLRLLVVKISTSFVNYENFLKSWVKKKHIANTDLMQDTKNNLDYKTIAKLVCCVTQCTLFKKGTTLYLNYKITLMWCPWNT